MARLPPPCGLLACSVGSEEPTGTGQEPGSQGETYFLALPLPLALALPFSLILPLLLLRFFFLDLSMERTR